MNKKERVIKVNKLIRLIASLDRKFFKSGDNYSEFILENNRVCYIDNYSRKKIMF